MRTSESRRSALDSLAMSSCVVLASSRESSRSIRPTRRLPARVNGLDVALGAVDLTAHASGSIQSKTLDAADLAVDRFDATVHELPIAMAPGARVSWSPSVIEVAGVDLSSGGSHLTASGRLDGQPGHSIQAQLTGQLEDLRPSVAPLHAGRHRAHGAERRFRGDRQRDRAREDAARDRRAAPGRCHHRRWVPSARHRHQRARGARSRPSHARGRRGPLAGRARGDRRHRAGPIPQGSRREPGRQRVAERARGRRDDQGARAVREQRCVESHGIQRQGRVHRRRAGADGRVGRRRCEGD